MSKGYWIGRVDVHDEQAYRAYIEAAGPIFAEHGARFLVRGGTYVAGEGQARARNVVIEFPSYEAALSCYRSDGYQRARLLRTPVSDGEVVIVEGHDGGDGLSAAAP